MSANDKQANKTENAHNDSISRLQVQTKTTSTRGQDEHLDVRILRVEQSDVSGTILRFRSTIQTKVFPIHHLQEVLHDIHDLRHLEEDEDLGTRLCVSQ